MQANPQVNQVTWSLDGRLLNSESDIIISNFTLTLTSVKREQGGKYTCSSSNVEGEGVSNEGHLKVLCKYYTVTF